MIVGIAGGSGSGKSTVVREVVRRLGPAVASVVRHDWYYRDLSHLDLGQRAEVNFDHPAGLETDLLVEHVAELAAGRPIAAPDYDFATHTRTGDAHHVAPTPVVILDGILVLAEEALRDMMDLRVFVDTGDAERLRRRLRRDTTRRGRSPESVVAQYERTVLPMHEAFVEPSRGYAHLTIRDGGFNRPAVEGLIGRIRDLLSGRSTPEVDADARQEAQAAGQLDAS